MPFLEMSQLKEKELFPGYKGSFIHTENMTFVFWNIKANAPFPSHSHPHEQVLNVIEGRFELTINDQKQVLESGSVAIVPPNAPHSGLALTDCRAIDVFYPVREDYRNR